MIAKRRAVMEGAAIDWAMAELLAFGSLAMEGHPVRLSGQDSGRGTFSQRHAEYHDYESDRVFTPLSQIGPFEVYNSPLSEYAVMGFEFGYSAAEPERAGGVGSAVRRFFERRADHYRPVHLVGGIEVESDLGAGAAAAAWTGRRRTGAFQRPPGTLPAALRREQHAGGLSDHPRRSISTCCGAR